MRLTKSPCLRRDDELSEPLPLAFRPVLLAPATYSRNAQKGFLRVKYNEILKIKCNEKAGFAGLSAIFTCLVKILKIKYNATSGADLHAIVDGLVNLGPSFRVEA